MPRAAVVSPTVPPVIILGADAVFAALPATPVQLAHACQRLGFASVFPASWGDELVAGACLRDLAERGEEPAILCICPRVRDRLLRAGSDLAPWIISLVAPPVAVARYLRSAYGARTLHITYAGTCPGAHDPAIDAQLMPTELLALCRDRGVSPAAQPQLFESVIPPDRRRSLSMPGGAPSDDALRGSARGRVIAELSVDDPLAALADRLIARDPVLLDLAPHIGCACSAVGDAVGGRDERRELMALEPPRSRDAVVDPSVEVELVLPLPWEEPRPVPRVAPMPAPAPAQRQAPAPAPTWIRATFTEAIVPVVAAPVAAAAHASLPPVVVLPELSHAVIREFPHGAVARHIVTVTRRRGASETPAAAFAGSTVPRAYLAKRPRRRPARRAKDPRSSGPRGSRSDLERRIDREVDLADERRTPRTPRPGIIPIIAEPPRPVPPPPARRKPGTVLGAFISVALSIAAVGTVGAVGGFPR